jgi:MFS family permease
VPVALTTSVAPAPVVTGRLNLMSLYRISPLGTVAAFAAGVANSAFWSLTPLVAVSIGLDTGRIATLMSTIILGGIALQWPVGWLSDRFDRRQVIVAMTALLTAVSVALYFMVDAAWHWLLVASFGFGGFSLTLYSLAVAHTNDQTGEVDLVQVSAGLLLMFGAGSVLGPMAAGAVIEHFGSSALFAFVAAVAAALTAFGLYRMTRRGPVPLASQTVFVAVPPTAGVPALDPRMEPVETGTSREAANGAGPGELLPDQALHDDPPDDRR